MFWNRRIFDPLPPENTLRHATGIRFPWDFSLSYIDAFPVCHPAALALRARAGFQSEKVANLGGVAIRYESDFISRIDQSWHFSWR